MFSFPQQGILKIKKKTDKKGIINEHKSLAVLLLNRSFFRESKQQLTRFTYTAGAVGEPKKREEAALDWRHSHIIF